MPSPRALRGPAAPTFAQHGIVLAILVVLALSRGSAQTGQLTIVTPVGASSLVSINITGTGFHTTAANNEVSFVPANGAPMTASATAIATVDATRDLRRITVRVPAGLTTGTAALQVRNKVTGLISAGGSLEVIALSLPDVTSAPAGTSGLAVRITGSPNTNFVAGKTQISFGTGITVNSVAVSSPTELIATITIPAAVAPSVRTVQMSSAQLAVLPGAFTVAAASPTNSNPTITSAPITIAAEGQSYSYDVNATDPDAGDTLTYSLIQPPAGMSIDPGTGLITWTPTADQTGPIAVTVRVNDSTTGAAQQAFEINVAAAPPPNNDPTITSAPITVATEGQPYSYDVNATDPDAGDTIAFALVQPPTGMTIDPITGVITWTPEAAHVPTVQVRVQANDNRGGSAEQTFTIDVAVANRAPQITSAPVTTAREQLAYNYQLVASDPNSDPLTYVLKTAPAGMTIDAAGLIVWTPPVNPLPTASVIVVVSDPALASDTQTFEIAVTAAPRVNQSPQITSSPNLAAEAAKPYAYDVNATDADAGDTLTYSLIQPPAGMSIDPGTGVIAWTPTAQQTGPIAVTVRVSDGTDTAQQAFEVTVAAAENINRAPSAHVGGPYNGEEDASIAFDGRGSTDPDGDPLTYSWDFGDGSKPGNGDTPSHTYENSGAFTVTLTVSDGRGGQNSRTTSVAIGAAGDRAPPSITLTGPREVLPGEQVTVTAQATDNVKVDKVRFEVDGANPSDALTQPFLRAITVPAVATPGTEIQVKATATDPSGNAGVAETTLTITAKPDTEKPVILLNAPPLAAPGTTFHVSATATDNAGVQSVAFSVNGGTAQSVATPPYESTFTVPEDAPIGAALNVRAVALDFSNNANEADALVTVVGTPDLQPPTVQLSARATAVAGSTLDLNAVAADNRGIVAVDFYVDGVKVATDSEAPYAAAFDIAPTVPAGRALQLEARAMDFAGLEGTDSRQTTIVSVSNIAQGALAGEVYDDTTGLPLEGVSVRLTGADIAGAAYTQEATTDIRGRYLINAVEGSGVLEVTRAGWSRVDRLVDVIGNKSTEVIDARLTPLTANAAIVNPVLGADVSTPLGNLIIPSGVLAAPAPLTMTAISQQGLQSLVPAGWTPVAIADVTPHDAAFNSAATLTFGNIENVPPSATLTLAAWDEEAKKWRAVGSAPRGTGALSHPIAHPGQFAWLIADTAPAIPPPAASGDFLAGVVAGRVPADATSVVLPQSTVVFYQPGVPVEVTGLVTLAARVPSGTVVFTRIAEAYQFTTGDEAHVEPYSQDIVLYQPIGGTAAGLHARYQVTPSLTFEAATLKSGVITVELFDPPLGPRLSDLITGNGGSVTTDTGERADVPANALPSPVPVQLQALDLDDVGVDIPEALSFVGGVQVLAAGAQFNESITLSIAKPAELPADAQILIARLTELGNTSRLVLVAVGRLVNDRIESSTLIGDAPSALQGIRSDGRYVFLRSIAPTGFATGLVRAVDGSAFPSALVSSNTVPLFALSGAAGQYVAAAREGAATLLAVDTLRNDAGSAQGVIATNAASAIDLQLTAQPPLVTSVTPANETTNVPLSNPIVITFSEPLNPATVTATSIVLAPSGGSPIAGTITLSNNNSVVTLRPSDPLPGDTPFTVSVASTIADLSGYTLLQSVTSHFTSLDVTAPPPPPAGNVTADMPGADGFSTVKATQGTAGLHDTVSIINDTRGTITPVLIEPNGGFTVRVEAGLIDKLRIRIVDSAGNETVVALPRFSRVNANGSVSAAIDEQGGQVDGPGGVSVGVPAGAFPTGAIVTVNSVPEANFPVTLTEEQRQVFGYSGGVELDFGGAEPAIYVNVSVPASPNDRPEDQWVVSQVVEVNGQQVLHVVDTAKLLNGKITTSSPPCPGVNARGVYGFHKSSRPVGVTYGTMNPTLGPIVAAVIADAPFVALPFLLPYQLVANVTPIPVCLPVLTGRVTVVPNNVTLTIASSQIAAGDEELVIKNLSANTESHFSRESLAFPLAVAGSMAQDYAVTGTHATGSRTLPFRLTEGAPGFVEIGVGVDAITPDLTHVVVKNISTTPPTQTTIPINSLQLKLSAAGGTSDSYSATLNNSTTGTSRPAVFGIVPSALGGGNLVARALPTTIDPTPAEVAAYNAAHPDAPLARSGRTRVEIINQTTGTVTLIPNASIVQGGFEYAFNGTLADGFAVRVVYLSDPDDFFKIPTFRITVTNTATGRVVKTIVLPSPPADRPLNLGPISDDTDPPRFTSGLLPLQSFDPTSGFLTFTFSEAMDAQSLKNNFKVRDRNGVLVRGEVRVSSGNTVVTFIPESTLALAEQYTVSFFGVVDRGGNQLPAPVRSLLLRTVAPRLVGSLALAPDVLGIKDMQIRKKDVAGVPSVGLVATTNSANGPKLVTIDVTQPTAPALTGTVFGGNYKKQITLLPDVAGLALRGQSGCSSGTVFNGDLAVTTSFNTFFSYVSFFDVTDPANPCLMANKLLTATPETLSSFSNRGTYHMLAFAKGIATIQHSQGIAAYAAVSEGGLMVADIGPNIPEKGPFEREKEPMLPGDYVDVVSRGGRLLALNRGTQQLEVVDPTLAVLGTLPLPDPPRRIVVAEGFPFDANGNGTLESGEFVDAAFVGGDRSLVMVDISSATPRIIGSIGIPSPVRDLDVDRAKRRMVLVDFNGTVYLIDLSRSAAGAFIDANLDGIDDRISWKAQLAELPQSVRLDKDRPYFYVGTSKGLDVYGLGPPNLTGVATFTYFKADQVLGLDYANPEKRPIRGAIVELRTAAGGLLQTTNTNATGYYSFDAPQATLLEVRIKAALGLPNNIHVDVIDNTSANAVYTKTSPTFTIAGSHTEDIYAESVWTPGAPNGTYTKREAAPFAILDMAYQAEKVVRQADPQVVFPMLHMAWSPTNRPTLGNKAAGLINTSHYAGSEGTLYILGAENLDTDEYDAQVVLHEWSHYFENIFSRSDSIGGAHGTNELLDPRLAFGEGFATAHAAMFTNDPLYLDTAGANQAGLGVITPLEQDNNAASGFFSEDAVMELLWDLFDPKSPAGTPEADAEGGGTLQDEVELGYKPIYQTMIGGQKSTRAFTSLFSFLRHLNAPYLADPALSATVGAKINALALAERVDLTTADEYELSTARLYTVIPVDGTLVTQHGAGPFAGTTLQTRIVNDATAKGNKLHSRVFFKFTVAAQGTYLIEAAPTNNRALSFTLNDGGTQTSSSSGNLGDTVNLTATLAPGTYTLAVTGFDFAAPNWTTSTVATFTMRITPQ